MSKKNKGLQMLWQRACAWLMAIALILVAVYGSCWLVWQGMLRIPEDIARLWALLATVLAIVLVPVAAWAGWRFGHARAEDVLAGMEKGITKVMGAATKTAGLRVETRQALRYTQRMQPPVVVLPNVEIVPRLQDGNGTVIEL